MIKSSFDVEQKMFARRGGTFHPINIFDTREGQESLLKVI
jgi:hypothetical protein